MKFSTAVPLLLTLASYEANAECSYMRGQQSRRLSQEEIEERRLNSEFFYGRLFDQATVPAFNATSVHRLVEASSHGGYMSEENRVTPGFRGGGFIISRNGTVTDQQTRGSSVAVSNMFGLPDMNISVLDISCV